MDLRNTVMWECSAHKPDELRVTIPMADDLLLSKRIPYKALLMSKHSTFQMGFIVKKKRQKKRKTTEKKIITICIHYFRSSAYET